MISASALNSGGSVTHTGNLTKVIGAALSGSKSQVPRSFGKGLSAGSHIQDQQQKQDSLFSSPPIDFDGDGMPGYPEGVEDVKSLYKGNGKAISAIGSNEDTLNMKTDLGADTPVTVLRAAQKAGVSGRDVLREMGYLHPGRTDLETAGREFIRAEAGSFALERHSPFQQNQLHYRMPSTPNLHPRDFAASLRIVQNEQKHSQSIFRQPDVDMMGEVARAVQARRLSGTAFTDDMIASAQSQNLQNWIDDSLEIS